VIPPSLPSWRLAPLLALALPLLSCASAGDRLGASSLALRLEPYFHKPGVTIAVAYQNLGTGAAYFRNEEMSFHAASTIKLPVMMALFQAVEARQLRLDEPIAVRNQFPSLADGSPYALDPAQDGDPELYGALGSTRPLEELIRRMITRSSNLATNLLIDKIGASRANDLMRSLGAYRIEVLRGVEDQKAFEAHLNNRVTAGDLAIALAALVKGTAFSAASNQKMLEILEGQEFNEKIPAYLPKGTVIAHKTGDIPGVHHDAAIVFPPGEVPYILVVLTTGYVEQKDADQAIAEISRTVWGARSYRGTAPVISPPVPRDG
jgi:beta-lactamase class A